MGPVRPLPRRHLVGNRGVVSAAPVSGQPAIFAKPIGESSFRTGSALTPIPLPPCQLLLASRCPVITVPSGRAKNHVPTGIQIVGRTYRDQDVFRAAMGYEKAAGPWFADATGRPKL